MARSAPHRRDAIGVGGDQGERHPLDILPSMLGFDAFLDFIGIGETRELEQRFAGQDNLHTGH